MCAKLILVLCIFAYSQTASAYSATFIRRCKLEDSKCTRESAQAALPTFAAGIPELKVETLDPLKYDKIDASAKELRLVLSDMTIRGLKDCQVEEVELENSVTKLTLKALCTVTLDGDYEMSGRLLLLPMEGNGKAHVVLRKLHISVNVDIDQKVGKDGKNHIIVKSWQHTFELKENADIHLENLFQGNEVLGQTARKLFDESPNDIIVEVAPPIIKAIISKIVKQIQRFTKHVSVEELVEF